MRYINFENGDYYEKSAAPKKNKKGKNSQRIAALEATARKIAALEEAVREARGSHWYVGKGSPETVPPSEWSPNAEQDKPRLGDIYLNSYTGNYYDLIPPVSN